MTQNFNPEEYEAWLQDTGDPDLNSIFRQIKETNDRFNQVVAESRQIANQLRQEASALSDNLDAFAHELHQASQYPPSWN